MNQLIYRQIVDIQAQAERLIKSKADLNELELFSQYNHEIKSYLLSYIDDSFILNHVNEIPELNLEEIEENTTILSVLLGLFTGGRSILGNKIKSEKALEIVRNIRGKYASLEFLLKNHFKN